MRGKLVILALAFCSAPAAAAAAGAHCDATPFTLGKPPAATPKASDEPKPKSQAAPVAAKKPEAKAASKQRLLATCKAGKKKNS